MKTEAIEIIKEEGIEKIEITEVAVEEALMKEMTMKIKKKHAKLSKKPNKMKLKSKTSMKRKSNMIKLIIKMRGLRDVSSLERMVHQENVEMKINNISQEMQIQIT